MQGIGTAAGITERRRVEAVIETLASIHHHGEGQAELAHDARNLVTALSLYCDLLDEPGVLAPTHRHYASELRLVAEGSRRLVERLSLPNSGHAGAGSPSAGTSRQVRLGEGSSRSDRSSGTDALIDDLRQELLGSRNLLAAIAGPAIAVTMTANGGHCGVAMTGENLIRLLVNLVRNAAESIQGRGGIAFTLDELSGSEGQARSVVLTVEDTGAGIAPNLLERVFERGFTTRAESTGSARGLGLSITRSILEAAGGRIRAENRNAGGARFILELPVRDDLTSMEHEP